MYYVNYEINKGFFWILNMLTIIISFDFYASIAIYFGLKKYLT